MVPRSPRGDMRARFGQPMALKIESLYYVPGLYDMLQEAGSNGRIANGDG